MESITKMPNILIIIPCCGSKKQGGHSKYNSANSIFNYLSPDAQKHLLELRRQLFEYFNIESGPEIQSPIKPSTLYLDAFQRYTGTHSQIYGRITRQSWDKLQKSGGLNLVIISALYGLLMFNEPIQDYNITMKNKIGSSTLKTWWRKNGLGQILKDYVLNQDIKVVKNLLSIDYNDAIRGTLQVLKIEHEILDFSQFKSGSNAHRGDWVNKFIRDY